MNILSNLDDIASVIIRPSRYLYKLTDLGSKSLEDGTITRTDFEVKNSRQLKLKCSMFSKVRPALCENILIYLHCNSGSRIEGIAYLN